MRVRMLTTQAGLDDKGQPFVREVEQEYDVPNKEAEALLNTQQAEPVARKGRDKAEKRVVAAAETR